MTTPLELAAERVRHAAAAVFRRVSEPGYEVPFPVAEEARAATEALVEAALLAPTIAQDKPAQPDAPTDAPPTKHAPAGELAPLLRDFVRTLAERNLPVRVTLITPYYRTFAAVTRAITGEVPGDATRAQVLFQDGTVEIKLVP